MAYVDPNYKTKKQFKDAVKAGVVHHVYNPSGLFEVKLNGKIYVEGPHYPQPHRWYAEVVVENGVVISVK